MFTIGATVFSGALTALEALVGSSMGFVIELFILGIGIGIVLRLLRVGKTSIVKK